MHANKDGEACDCKDLACRLEGLGRKGEVVTRGGTRYVRAQGPWFIRINGVPYIREDLKP